jgi:hypothetical protein
MAKYQDLIGKKFGMLLVIERLENSKSNKTVYRCLCDCGKTKDVLSINLKEEQTISCGCIRKSKNPNYKKVARSLNYIKEYRAWKGIRARCYNNKNKKYLSYGGRGIIVCDRWIDSYKNFLQDMGICPDESKSIERIDNNGNYEPSNCRWATIDEQANNRRTNVFITYNNETLTLAQWGKKIGVSGSTIAHRLKIGWSIEKTLTTEKLRYNWYDLKNGKNGN